MLHVRWPSFEGKIKDWSKIKRASYWMAAEVLALYPHQHLVFLARDATIIYDIAKLLTRGSSHSNRIHLLSISQGSVSKNELQFYLNSKGITDSLISENGLVLVDSGYRASMLDRFRSLFPKHVKKIQGHMIHAKPKIYSGQRKAAMSFAAFEILNPGVLGHYNINDYSGVAAFENLPHTTARTTDYENVNGVWKAKSLNVADTGEVEMAHAWQQDIKWQFGSNSSQNNFLKIVSDIRLALRNPLDSSLHPEVRARLPLLQKTRQDLENLSQHGDADYKPPIHPDLR